MTDAYVPEALSRPAPGRVRVWRLRPGGEFERVRQTGRSWPHRLLIVIVQPRADEPSARSRVAVTAGKRLGSAVVRNRIKRRLREAVRACQSGFQPRHDYVLIGRREALSLPFGQLVADLNSAVTKIHSTKLHASRAPGPRDDA